MSKITVKHFLNKRLKHEVEGDILVFPIYLSITYDRINIRTPSNIRNGFTFVIADDQEFLNTDNKGFFKLNYERDLIKRSLEYFIIDEKEKKVNKHYFKIYPLKKYKSKNERQNQINTYIDFYTHSIYDVVQQTVLNELKSKVLPLITSEAQLLSDLEIDLFFMPHNKKLLTFIEKNNIGKDTELNYKVLNYFNHFLSNQGLIYGYDMPYIDWIENKTQIIFKEFLIKNYNNELNNDDINKIISKIDNIVNKENYFDTLLKTI